MHPQRKTHLVVGLGNPGKKYQNTRHNIGFMAVDHLSTTLNTNFRRLRFSSMVAETQFAGNKVIIAKPRTFMNNSGQAVRALKDYFKVPQDNILIIFDDADLDFETIRLRSSGGSSGQKGMASIIAHLGTEDISRMRIGVGRPPGQMLTADYVLKPFAKSEFEILPFVFQRSTEAAKLFITEGVMATMNQFNQKPR